MSANPVEFFDLTRRIPDYFANLPTTGESRLYAVIGGRATGKTTVLEYLADGYKNGSLATQPGSMVAPVLIKEEPSLTALNSIEDTLTWLFEKLLVSLKKNYNLCALPDDMFKRFGQSKYEPANTFGAAFGQMQLAARNRWNKFRVVALIDNADRLAVAATARDLFNSFHILLKDSQVNGFLDLIMAGGDSLYDRLTEPDAAWRDNAEILTLACFGPAEVKAFLSAKTKNQLPNHIGLRHRHELCA